MNKDIQKPISESIFTINCSNKCQILNNGINCKKKAERTICKRFSDGSENYIEKTCWETSFSRYYISLYTYILYLNSYSTIAYYFFF